MIYEIYKMDCGNIEIYLPEDGLITNVAFTPREMYVGSDSWKTRYADWFPKIRNCSFFEDFENEQFAVRRELVEEGELVFTSESREEIDEKLIELFTLEALKR